MRSFLLLLLLSTPALASQRRGPHADDADVPAMDPPEGSLWDRIEDVEGAVPQEEAVVQQSEELAAARDLEDSFLDLVVQEMAPPVQFYRDPVAALAADPLHLDRVNKGEFDIPMVVNEDVIRWMKYFTGPGRKYYHRWLGRATRFRPMMYEKLEAAGLPRDLVYLSMIESGYSTQAYSSAAAVGLWQFISSTGKQYGLRIDWWVDERRDPERSTEAAIDFLGDLHKQFGHWYLAWAAYNGGPGRVSRGISRHGTKDFWELVAKDAFASETDNYVPKLLAAAIIGKHPERYGFTGVEYQERLEYETVSVPSSVGLDVLAKCAGVSVEQLQELNPHLLRWSLPPDPQEQKIHIPTGKTTEFLAALEKVPPQERLTYTRHKVRSGETLSAIADRYNVSAASIQSVNRIGNANRITVGMELVIPTAGTDIPPEALTSTAGEGRARSDAPESSSSSSRSAPSRAKSAAPRTHTVARGENLSSIASRYGVSTSDLMRWNDIDNANHITVGQKLKVSGGSASSSSGSSSEKWTSYTVRKGDTLSEIAERYGCSVSDLKSWNGMRSSTIVPGQKLKIKK